MPPLQLLVAEAQKMNKVSKLLQLLCPRQRTEHSETRLRVRHHSVSQMAGSSPTLPQTRP